MVELLKKVLALALRVAGWLPGVRRARRRKAFRAAAAKGDESAMNRLWQEMEDEK